MHLGYVELGRFRVDAIDGGAVWMDGGGIFGVVPKTLWCEVLPPDDQNRVRLSFFSLLVRADKLTVVIEAGSAAHEPPKVREAHNADDSRLVETLTSLGVSPEDVDYFVPSHLHFDHAGGASTPDGRALTFPNATYILQKAELDEARNPCPINKNAYLPGDIVPLSLARLRVVNGAAEIAPGITVERTGGHSVGHQVIRVGAKPDESVVFCGDIVPMSQHISPRWMCAFDINPVDTFNVKVDILNRAAADGTIIAPGHGGHAPLLTVERNDRGRYVAHRLPSIKPLDWKDEGRK